MTRTCNSLLLPSLFLVEERPLLCLANLLAENARESVRRFHV